MRDISQRLVNLESKLASKNKDTDHKNKTIVEICKIIFSGWTVLGFVFLLLFYSPLRDALNAIPEKVRSADEIGVLGVSLKSTLRIEATKFGELSLSETIPTLSPSAIELLLRANPNPNSLIRYSLDEQHRVSTIDFPDKLMLSDLFELQTKGLIIIYRAFHDKIRLDIDDINTLLDEFRQSHPGNEVGSSFEKYTLWELKDAIPD